MASPASFPSDQRYPDWGHFHRLPKLAYILHRKKLIFLDPKPGEEGYFAVIVRSLNESSILNLANLVDVVHQGQTMFQQFGFTNDQMNYAQQLLRNHLEQSQTNIENEWNATLEGLGLPPDETNWDPKLFQWRNKTAELIAYPEASAEWLQRSADQLASLSGCIVKATPGFDLDKLTCAIQQRFASVTASYANEFTFLYQIMGGRAADFMAFERGLSRLCATMDAMGATALKEFMEETGADKDNYTLGSEHIKLLNLFVPNWHGELSDLGCSLDETAIHVTRSQKAKRKTLGEAMERLLKPVNCGILVPDNRTTKNAGYSTTVYEAQIDILGSQTAALFLSLIGGSDAAEFRLLPILNQIRE
ncbi:hypothetical protein S40293_11537 [Stachybotrys chartarum IBT 40293]|nr:hypothetical protein S40293_11537 [Stachybotrys chartarum IBT 40293]